ncbi:jg4261, partial [Pararge aegeria aegeria]
MTRARFAARAQASPAQTPGR